MGEIKKETVFVQMSDGKNVALHTWIPEGEIRAVVQLSHGMAEYAKRYDRFGTLLAENGIAFMAHDHRGHGETAGAIENLGYLADRKGFFRVADDVHELIQKWRKEYPGKKVFLFGHSFGSFVSQCVIEKWGSELDGVVLCGSAGPNLGLTRMGHFAASLVCFFRGKKRQGKFLDGMAFGAYNNRIENPKTTVDWLTRDPAEVQKYQDSPYCGFVCTNEFFRDFMAGFNWIHTPSHMKQIPQTLPVYIIAGDADPVGGYGTLVQKLYDTYKANGIADLNCKLYPGARHEILNETNREEVETDVLNWFNTHI
ncbi:MAG: lysophospholipase [Treponemataceae bacterium]|nr:lysophospholipase [Treponemataceae bacterium]